VEFFDFSAGRISQVARMLKEPEISDPGLTVSRDGRFFLYVQDDQNGSDLMMMDGFH
jgi:hypothetical protein